jgi:hypothetical protein
MATHIILMIKSKEDELKKTKEDKKKIKTKEDEL